MQNTTETGKTGEKLAAHYLQSRGYTILAVNWRHRHWEVDIIASKKGHLHFVEVKTRKSLRYGYPEESITREKMRHLRNAAEAYQLANPQWQYLQFDVLSLILDRENQIREAFLIEDVYF
ncbi:MAG TPA: YraN family protein [Sediminibacterium sp.]|nr:YraN family protein [Sediminibacterium sp.]